MHMKVKGNDELDVDAIALKANFSMLMYTTKGQLHACKTLKLRPMGESTN